MVDGERYSMRAMRRAEPPLAFITMIVARSSGGELFGVLFASQQLTGWTLHLNIDSAFLDCLTRAFVGSRTDARSLP